MDFIPYKVNEVLENVFYQIPKELFTNPIYNTLDSTSILLYGLLLDRLSVSMKNKWIDKDGNIYIIYSRKEAQKKLRLSDKPVSKAFKKLEEAKLIYEIRSGFKKHNTIYVGKIAHQSVEKTMNRIMSDSRNGENTIIESENVRRNYNEKKYNNYSNNSSFSKNKSCNFEQRVYAPGELDKLYCNFENLKEGEWKIMENVELKERFIDELNI